jgi:hypothetical protein
LGDAHHTATCHHYLQEPYGRTPRLRGVRMSTGHDTRLADVTIPAATAEVEEARGPSPGTSSVPTSERVAQAICERLLEMPTGAVIGLMWVTGAALIGSCALVVYVGVWVLLRLVAGS